jgi:hypothetical protein
MNIGRILTRNRLIAAGGFLGWTLIFALVYAQSPLYTSNQNVYFLHGLARAGYGFLNRDWTANTLEEMPVFSWLVSLTYLIFHSGIPYYVYYGLLMGIYLASMYGIMDLFFNLHRSTGRTLAFLALFMAAHSAAMRYLLSRLVDVDSTFLLEGGVAGQRLLGQVFQPSVFGVLLMLSIYWFLRKRTFLSIVPLAVAIYLHPVYLLSGGLLTIAYMWVLYREAHSLKRPLLFGVTALLAVIPVLAYTAYLNTDPSPQIAQKALDILVNFRNPYHAIITSWLNWTVFVQALVLLAGLFIARKTRLFPILVIVTLGMLILTAIQAVTRNEWLALIFPWRVSVLLVPLGTTLVVAFAVTKLMDVLEKEGKPDRLVAASSLFLMLLLVAIGVIRFQIESSRQAADPALPMMEYVTAHKSPTDVYMVPAKMINFRLVTGAPIYIDFNTTPDRDRDVLEWYRRLQNVYWFYGGSYNPCAFLKQMATQEGVTHAVVQSGVGATACRTMPTVYQDTFYTVYYIGPTPP